MHSTSTWESQNRMTTSRTWKRLRLSRGFKCKPIDLPGAKSETLQSQWMIGSERFQIRLRAWWQEKFSFALRRYCQSNPLTIRHGFRGELEPASWSVGCEFQSPQIG